MPVSGPHDDSDRDPVLLEAGQLGGRVMDEVRIDLFLPGR